MSEKDIYSNFGKEIDMDNELTMEVGSEKYEIFIPDDYPTGLTFAFETKEYIGKVIVFSNYSAYMSLMSKEIKQITIKSTHPIELIDDRIEIHLPK